VVLYNNLPEQRTQRSVALDPIRTLAEKRRRAKVV
jgi:hypothetical protein